MYEDGCSECGSIMTFGEAKDRKKSKSKKSGPDKKTAKKILKVTKKFK
jgi:DNA-directed RNA polymerase subunit M/transcription elongation factor TFIIS